MKRITSLIFAFVAALGALWTLALLVRGAAIGSSAETGNVFADPMLALYLAEAAAIAFIVLRPRRVRAILDRLTGSEAGETDWAVVGIPVLVLTGVGFCLRIAAAGRYALNPDEVMFVFTAGQPSLAETWRESLSNVHPPGNYFLLHLWLRAGDSELWSRLPSILCGTGLIVAAYCFGTHFGGRIGGLTVAFLVTFSPGLIELSRVGRNYMPGMLCVTIALACLLRFWRDQREGRGGWGFFYAFALFEFLSAFWFYSLVLIYLAANLLLAIDLARRREAMKAWMRVLGAQIPLGILLIVFLLTHVLRFPEGLVNWMHEALAEEFSISARAILFPLIQALRYLAGPVAGKGAFYVLAVGGLALAAGRRWMELGLCAATLLLAYGFAWADALPLGETRYSAYLWPFLFGPIAAAAAESISGFARIGRDTKRLAARWAGTKAGTREDDARSVAGRAEAGRDSSGPRRLIGQGIALGLAVLFLNSAAGHYADGVTWDPVGGFDPKRTELPATKQELLSATETLQGEIAEGDVVLLSYQSLLVLRRFWGLPPVHYDPYSDFEFEHDGMWLVYRAVSDPWIMDAEAFLRKFADLAAEKPLTGRARVWSFRAGWDPSLAESFRRDYPGLALDWEEIRLSRHRLFMIDAATAAQLASGLDEPAAP